VGGPHRVWPLVFMVSGFSVDCCARVRKRGNVGQCMKRTNELFLVRALVLLAVMVSPPSIAERQPVLGQIKVPHSYYYREMYLPQLTSGPSSLAWSPDGTALVYSMAGSLWRQEIGSDIAIQLTSGPGYDYQPDWSPDGERIVFTRYDGDRMELMLLDIAGGSIVPLTSGGDVNLEPRWSPDGSRLAFVSTRDTGRFHVYIGELRGSSLEAAPLIDGERESLVPRYYYDSWDHELSPAWTPDGESVVYVANPEIPYGTGAIFRRGIAGDAAPELVRMEETTWRARPDVAPDGRRVVYASYLGRQWHQLWLTAMDGSSEPFPLSYGEFDISGPRWSPDGSRIAYVSNEQGNVAIRVQEVVGGKVTELEIDERRYLQPMAELRLDVVDASGRWQPARISVVGADGRSHAPVDAWVHADDGFDPASSRFEASYFHAAGATAVTVPVGPTLVSVWRGPEYEIERRMVNVAAGRDTSLDILVERLPLPPEWQAWVGADVHVHMNYGGTYRNTPDRLVRQAESEDLDIVFNLVVNKEQRIPDVAYFSPDPDAASSSRALLLHGQEYHTSFWGHMGMLGLASHLLLPDYSAYPGGPAASLYPDNATAARLAREQGALVGYVHPFLEPPDPSADEALTNSLPVNAALGLVDYYEVIGFADHRASAEVWYRLLNTGLRIPAAGGTDAMANYASLRGPVGLNRTYARTTDPGDSPAARRDAWLDALRSGATLATNGPILGLEVNGLAPGAEIGPGTLSYAGYLRSAVPVDHLELVLNGRVLREFELSDDGRKADIGGELRVDEGGWLLLRAWSDEAHAQLFDVYPYATTSPVYVSNGGARHCVPEAAQYFVAWIERVRESAAGHPDYFSDAERDTVLANIDAAQAWYRACL